SLRGATGSLGRLHEAGDDPGRAGLVAHLHRDQHARHQVFAAGAEHALGLHGDAAGEALIFRAVALAQRIVDAGVVGLRRVTVVVVDVVEQGPAGLAGVGTDRRRARGVAIR